jgi:hypothetical protein
MQIASVRSALGRAELGYMNIISAPRFFNGVHGLVQVTDKMHQEFQSFNPILSGCVSIREHLLEHCDSIDYAVVVILLARGMLVIRTKTIALLGKSASIHRNIDKVPAETLGTIAPDIVGPNCNCSQIVIAQQFLHMQPRSRSQSPFRNIANDAMALRAPSEQAHRK